ncbi:MAG: excalibur calcium-binding domain-containing protein [Sulfurimonas sp.]|uniref:excalibur calcium-binding domain-containing protein n=1 Tax=Sulfurimonas sp. TaxID=2022749 RepID=UPI002615A8C4|nr:excalibur calcium-binding domain-containing protein [Sulfurimonas sp.]MCW8894252.1 excalibur calcium-binding domain-containing protein [Sulfurimonas sp.]MCW8954007.1 excalibur calcium-binding domain-containing protein [Sulfurimonas sp.]MCW9067061.1 excalibur calcium-binding domain-containing protein [Sulfurimonas sp.]
MKIVTLIVIALTAIWYVNTNTEMTTPSLTTTLSASESKVYECDGRQYCSQMTSCEEAKFFLNNCPDTKMDGNNDGIPCERQWCK